MAFRPSARRTARETETAEPNLFPVINLMVVLIPLLLTSAEFIKLGVIELNLPPAVTKTKSVQPPPNKQEIKLDLAITITDEGFYLSSSLAVAHGKEGKGPTIPKVDGEYDFEELTNVLYDLKKKAEGKFPDTDRIVILAEPDIDYQTVVSTMDASRSVKVENEKLPLFPKVSLSAKVL